MRILVVDDADFFRHSCAAVLQALGHQVIEAENGHEATLIWESQKRRIDAIVTDVNMPRMNGIDLLSYLGGERQPPRCYVHSGDDFFDLREGRLELKDLGNIFPFAEFHDKAAFAKAIQEFLVAATA